MLEWIGRTKDEGDKLACGAAVLRRRREDGVKAEDEERRRVKRRGRKGETLCMAKMSNQVEGAAERGSVF